MPRPNNGPQLRPSKKRGGTFYIYWTENGSSREHSTGTSDQKNAVEYFGEWLAAHAKTEWTGPRRSAETKVIDVLELYATEHVKTKIPSAAGRAKAGEIIATLSKWWTKTLDFVKPETCRAYGRARGVALSTVARELSVLRAAIHYAHKNGKLVDPPFVELPSINEQPPPRERWLLRSEAARLLWESRRYNDHLARFIMMGLKTGQRPGALLDLRWTQVDFDNNRINFNPPGQQRSNKKRPIVPIPRRLRWFLLRWQARATSPYVISFNGQQIQSVKIAFRKARKRAGLGPDVTPYTLRHTCATWMMHKEVDIQLVGGWLGHASFKTTMRYQHHHPSFMDKARKVMD